ncbi:MAG TPA: hypothetical protein VMH20_07450 [Verrucomicrobiae bacterium]|nr:hypothetical protein [Verrucomicrobiae bacterium]
MFPRWRKYNGGRGINPYWLAEILKTFDLYPSKEYFDGRKRSGYWRDEIYETLKSVLESEEVRP